MILKTELEMTAVYNLKLYDIVVEGGSVYTVVSMYENGNEVTVTYSCHGYIEKRMYLVHENVYTIKEYSTALVINDM